MSDSSGDSESSVALDDVPSASISKTDHDLQRQPANESGNKDSLNRKAPDESYDRSEIHVEDCQMSRVLGHTEFLTMKTKMDEIHAWLEELLHDYFQGQAYVTEQHIYHYKQAIMDLRSSLNHVASKTECVSKYVDLVVNSSIASEVTRFNQATSSLKGPGSAIMKDLIRTEVLKQKLVAEIKKKILGDGTFLESHLLICKQTRAFLSDLLIKKVKQRAEEKFQAEMTATVDELTAELQQADLM